MTTAATIDGTEIIGRYALHGEIASGGMAVVHFGRLLGPVGFSRPVAIKRLHPQLAREPNVRAMFIDEARLASRIRHPNVVPTLDVVTDGGDLLLVMEYVHGESLQQLLRAVRKRGEPVPLRITLAVMTAVLHGLHAAHEATTETGQALNVVHRDVSPQNIMVGVDGVARVLDFGIARATVRLENTREGIVKGKLAYMAPEQLGGVVVDRRAAVYAATVVLWEMLTGKRLFVRGAHREAPSRHHRGAQHARSRHAAAARRHRAARPRPHAGPALRHRAGDGPRPRAARRARAGLGDRCVGGDAGRTHADRAGRAPEAAGDDVGDVPCPAAAGAGRPGAARPLRGR